MLKKVKPELRKLRRRLLEIGLAPDNDAGIESLGYRQFVGGEWDEIGRLQFDFMVQQGLQPSHCFLDIACGALRGGVHFIEYLEPGNYLGLEKEEKLIKIGIEQELGTATYEQKRPEFIISSRFEFERFSRQPQFSLAQSLLTHLNREDIHLCLNKLRIFVAPGHIFFASFWEGDSDTNRKQSHSLAGFNYSQTEMAAFGSANGWQATYIGDWNHARGLKMMQYTAV